MASIFFRFEFVRRHNSHRQSVYPYDPIMMMMMMMVIVIVIIRFIFLVVAQNHHHLMNLVIRACSRVVVG